jgi:hypothetical protein
MEVIRAKFRLAAEKIWLWPAESILLNPVYKKSRLKIGNAKGTSRPVVVINVVGSHNSENKFKRRIAQFIDDPGAMDYDTTRRPFFASGLGNVAASRCMVLWQVVGRCEPSSCANCPDKQASWLGHCFSQ